MKLLIPTGQGVGACTVNSMAPFLSLSRELDRLFGPPVTGGANEASSAQASTPTAWTPALDIAESLEGVQLKLDLPGVAREQVHVSLQEDLLTISGERPADVLEKGAGYHRQERVSGPFRRTVRLGCPVDASGVTAQFRDGVLVVSLPKAPEAKARQIDIASN